MGPNRCPIRAGIRRSALLALQDLMRPDTSSAGIFWRHAYSIFLGLFLSASVIWPGSASVFSQQAGQWSPVPLPPRAFPDVLDLPSHKEFPDPLMMFDGRRVTTKEQWERERRPELQILFQHYMYGYMPPPPSNVGGAVDRIDLQFMGGKATRKEVRISFGPPGTPPINLLLVVPNNRAGPSPVFLGLNFRGNDSVYTLYSEFPFELIVDRGYAVATAAYGDIFPDRPDFSGGIFPFFRRQGQTDREPHDWGAIAMWACGLQRVIDYLVTDRDIDPARIAVTGHSRLGKTALLAAAYDERISLVIPHQAGTGGSAPSRKKNPRAETVKQINDRFPHWFNKVFARFNDAVDRLPFDQHALVALVAPRPVLFTNGVQDQWADPAGQFEVLRAADPVYRLLGSEGLSTTDVPPVGRLVDSALGYYIREGGHQVDQAYWKVFLDFADRHLRRRR
jgi:dienelactone hydrolase